MTAEFKSCCWCGNATLEEGKCEKFREPIFYARLKQCANFEGYVATTQVPIRQLAFAAPTLNSTMADG